MNSTNDDKLIHYSSVSIDVCPFQHQVERHVSDATSKGSEVVVGGTRREDLGGWYYQPSVLTKVNTDMLFSREETFGPVAPIIRYVYLTAFWWKLREEIGREEGGREKFL